MPSLTEIAPPECRAAGNAAGGAIERVFGVP
jgi:hypothetical protein